VNAAGEAYGQVSLARLLPLRAVTGELRAVPHTDAVCPVVARMRTPSSFELGLRRGA